MKRLALAAVPFLLAVSVSAQTAIRTALEQAGHMAAAASSRQYARAPQPEPADWSVWFTDGLYDAAGNAVSTSTLDGKIVGIYFSAHWCPPCKAFTPKLIAFRDKHKAEFEVVFVSADVGAKEQTDYMTETGMPWPAVPHASASSKRLDLVLSNGYIPQLVVLSPSGKLIGTNERATVETSPDTALAGWKKTAGLK